MVPCARQFAIRVSTPFGLLRHCASHIWMGAGSSCARCFGHVLARVLGDPERTVLPSYVRGGRSTIPLESAVAPRWEQRWCSKRR
jgi:hypothetical protein